MPSVPTLGIANVISRSKLNAQFTLVLRPAHRNPYRFTFMRAASVETKQKTGNVVLTVT